MTPAGYAGLIVLCFGLGLPQLALRRRSLSAIVPVSGGRRSVRNGRGGGSRPLRLAWCSTAATVSRPGMPSLPASPSRASA
ncbi:hypothetical protein F2981_16200 [Sinorhizobium meliloti]|nr:hypothetical protein [Sinorhizobium meliloti]